MLLPHKRHVTANVFTILAIAILLLGLLSSFYTYLSIDRAGRAHIIDRAYTMVKMLPDGAVSELTGTEADTGNEAYAHVKRLLTDVRSVNRDMRFAYLVGNREGELFFYVDSEDESSEDYSPPGQTYDEAPWQMKAVFEDGIARSDGPTADRWGVWISGYAPVVDETGTVVALLGIDLPARQFIQDAVTYSLLPFLVALLIAALLMAVQQMRAKEERALREKAEFLSIASHEIRTPLTGVRWGLEDLISSKERLSPEVHASLVEIHDVATRLLDRLNNLLEVTKLEQRGVVVKEEVRVRPFLEDIAKSFSLAASQKRVTIVIGDSIPADLSVSMDEGIMRHVFFNLLSNAIKYTKEGSRVEVSYARNGAGHAFSVTDEGEGIPEQERMSVFAGYHRAQMHEHSGTEGTGLGLYLVQKAVELVGGSVEVGEGEGGGARLTVTLP